ncbi:mannosylphosphate transferase (Mnn4), putative [Cordyceps militaris CM01]|uniref:Mannosylphosphate transferase (Mnn4), putative n=1 Tax=Cordyceps militaris (strain CM01) TaxID=983644 RepID=G3J8C2_CORMM|nr:mannosylphosphate transferase (Mnn4), putative [Cordyceps militaris CM01]EGX93911.1 mannosylphosphate transferase (Mnn4), putative [Cordyceps militaris CM01]
MTIASRLRLVTLLLFAAGAASVLSQPWEPPAAAPVSYKYFQEPGGSLARMHYDLRYFKGEAAYDERQIILRDLIRSYLQTMQAMGVETWLAHGTLLGWWWNAHIMPWDYDLDVQVSNATMAWLANGFNGTEHTVTFGKDAGSAIAGTTTGAANSPRTRTYLLDINPHYTNVDSRGGYNMIDGRWIDTDHGMFVDITVLRERAPERRPGEWSCKNGHQYKAHDLWPLRVSEFEGVPARIPYNVEKILSDEYSQRSMTKETFQSHQWDHDLKQWVIEDPEQRGRAKDAGASQKKQQLLHQGRF